MSSILERRRAQIGRAKAEAAGLPEQHFYRGSHNVWYGETVHECECGFESHDKAEVLAHIEAAEKLEAMVENDRDWSANTR